MYSSFPLLLATNCTNFFSILATSFTSQVASQLQDQVSLATPKRFEDLGIAPMIPTTKL